MSFATQAYNLTTATDFFKRIYARANLQPLCERDTPFLRRVNKVQTPQGQGIVVPINTSLPMGPSATASVAVANAYGSRGKHWILTTKNFYARVNIDAKAMAASKENVASYLDAKKKETDEVLVGLGLQMEQALWQDGSGCIGEINGLGGSEATRVFTLAQPEDAINFHVNMTLHFDNARTGSGDARTDTYLVTAVDDVNGTVTATQIVNGADPVVDGDFIFVDGNRDLMLSGIQNYIPASDPGVGGVPATLNNVDRTERPTLLAGWRGADEGSIEESAKALVSKMGRYSKIPTSALWLSFSNWRKLEQELGSRAYRDEKAAARFNTSALILQTPKGDIPVVAGPYTPSDFGLLADHASAKLYHLGGFPHMRQDGGHPGVRLDWALDEDGEGIEYRAWPEFAITDCSGWGRFPIS